MTKMTADFSWEINIKHKFNWIFKPAEIWTGLRKKNRGDETICVITHVYMEMSQGHYVAVLNKQKCHFFFLL
jgi:hypothetical protein